MSVETTFGVQGAGHPPVAPGQMPQYIQFRINGVNLGGPDVTVVDFVGGGFLAAVAVGADGKKTLTVSFG